MIHTIQGMHQELWDEYMSCILDLEIKMHEVRRERLDTRLQIYFNSSQNRYCFAMIMNRAFIHDKPVTITECCEIMGANRSSVSLMVDECEKEGWINVVRSQNRAFCSATDTLFEAFQEYCQFRKQVNKSIIGDAFKSLSILEGVMAKANIPIDYETIKKPKDTSV